MQWNRINMSKDELKRKQDEYIREALKISQKAKHTEEPIKPMTIAISDPVINTEESSDIKEETSAPFIDEHESISFLSEQHDAENISTAATEEITDNDIVESPVEELFEDIFITEEETEKKLMDAELYSKENSESVPDFEKYIKNHNRKSENTNSDKIADE